MTGGQKDRRCKRIQRNTSESGIKCVCLNARSITNKKNELKVMVDDMKPHIIGITESWANNYITDAELGLAGYVMFRKERIGRRGGGVLFYLYIKESVPAYYTSLDTLCSSFSKFFTDKITRIRSNFVKKDHGRDFPEPPHVENTMDQFTHTTTSEVRSIILTSTNASCDLDPFPTRLLKHYIDDLIVPITAIINLSMREVVVPPGFKQALVTPLIYRKHFAGMNLIII